MKVEELNTIADWILALPKDEQFKISSLDFLKLAKMLKKYETEQLTLTRVSNCCKPELSQKDFKHWIMGVVIQGEIGDVKTEDLRKGKELAENIIAFANKHKILSNCC